MTGLQLGSFHVLEFFFKDHLEKEQILYTREYTIGIQKEDWFSRDGEEGRYEILYNQTA